MIHVNAQKKKATMMPCKGKKCVKSVFIHDKSVFHYLVIDDYLHGVVPPLDQHQLIGLTRDSVGEGRPHSRRGVGLNPQTHAEGEHLRKAPLGFGIHVVGSQGEGELKLICRPGVFTCR